MEYWLSWFHQGNDHPRLVAQAAERMGFKGIAVPDHVAIPKDYQSVHPSGFRVLEPDIAYPDPLITMASMAAVTTTVEFMTYVYVLPMREPFSVAKQAATVAMLSDYRFGLGVGAGWNTEEIALLGYDPRSRGKRMDEMLTIMRDFWDDGEAEFEGEHYRFGPTGQFPVPKQRIPIWIGGKSDVALRRAARHDGWMGMSYPMDEIETLLAKLDVERKRHLDETGDAGDLPFRRFVMPLVEPSKAAYQQLEDWGIDGTVVMLWDPNDPVYRALEPKLEAMERFAAEYIAG
ncbi:MAG: TIGR03619 family F420-dependent LLM class oxidoreductase [Deltaproteobacteria bacterium]|nr:TIGR03619 family F420-dependent LLM class oxidoreductase [Deltaproteobacteria bacterium]MBW2396731.1 TIGR03619 family F420-dependent LLM class oxidoreductase [Deltaproteobacteria bacterium]